MSVAFVQSNQVTNVNGNDFGWPNNPNGTPMQIPCDQTQIIDSFWRIPTVLGNRVTGYSYLVATDNNKPQADAIKILRVKLLGPGGITQMDLAVLDSDNIATSSPPNYFAYLCDGSGGSLPVMPTVTIPVPIMQQDPQTTAANGDKTFIFAFPDNPAALEYQVNGIWFNGIVPTPAYSSSGITTVAGVAAYANSNWGDYGTFTNPSTNILQLVNTSSDTVPVLKAGIDVELKPKDYCFNLASYSTPALVNGVQFGSGNIIPVPAFMLTNNPTVLYNVLRKVMSSGTTFNTTSVANKLGINTVQATPKLYNDASLVATASSGVCA